MRSKGAGSSEVEGVRAGGAPRWMGTRGLRDSEMQGVPGGSGVGGGRVPGAQGLEVEGSQGVEEGVPGLRDSGGGGPGGQGQ